MSTDPNRKKTAAREALLDAAEALFIAKGYQAVGTRELVDAAGVNLAAIQYHFGSKAKLFVECVGRMMKRDRERSPLAREACQECSLPCAAAKLVRYIELSLNDVCRPAGPEVCRLIFREIFDEAPEDAELREALISSVINEKYRPADDLLLTLVRQLKPGVDDQSAFLIAHSVVGQCAFYVTHRPFIERLRSTDYTQSPAFDRAVEHVASFTLRALGFSDDEIARAIDLGRSSCDSGRPSTESSEKSHEELA